MFGRTRIAINDQLLVRVRRWAERSGYSSAEELITHVLEREIAHPGLTYLRVVGSMHERKALMSELSEGFIALPGGTGTLEELFEVLTWAQLGEHEKPCGLLNLAGYYDPLVALFDHMVAKGFLSEEHRATVLVEIEPEPLLDAFAHYSPPDTVKWIDKEET